MTEIQLANLVQMDSPKAVLEEAAATIACFSAAADLPAIRSAFDQTVSLYRGAWPDIKGCNTDYHDLKHVTDCFLAMVRLMHGAVENGLCITPRQVHQAAVAALLHDSGYLQNCDDTLGTGAKFTLSHVRRSMDFLQRYHRVFGLQSSEINACMAMIHCTDLGCTPAGIPFPDPASARLGKMLATADVLAQMADRTYLEKLLFLFYELDEACLNDYCDELDLLKRSRDFFIQISDRMKNQLDGSDRFMIHHFRSRWHIDADLYRTAIDGQHAYLKRILKNGGGDPRNRLRRGNVVNEVRARYN
ncbi:hypothetical protein DSCO28_47970 [Desulfosarcina ovata subsp. sediminis]|uniref:HD/PDEase domain-containing protein n=1 Tax=Desulfosarcina ovata subsp. sediminis TaxID=885957 RepID=A0A5K7ZVV7_9BACT|nr:hypothetical protein [Desulfosarcina ovata]BBO84231.1 hypothetical protein DSCO28_47970 [Desulfosarcina ovata subsp. sediminis]